MLYSTTNRLCLLASLALALSGCTSEPATPVNTPAPDAHAHPDVGPHRGDLIELGNEEYHAELVHDAEAVTIYVLNGSADQTVAIEAPSVTINAVHHGQPAQYALDAQPEEGDPEGKSCRFVSNASELVAHIDDEGIEHRLVLTIDGKSYRGTIKHGHKHGDEGQDGAGDHHGHNH